MGSADGAVEGRRDHPPGVAAFAAAATDLLKFLPNSSCAASSAPGSQGRGDPCRKHSLHSRHPAPSTEQRTPVTFEIGPAMSRRRIGAGASAPGSGPASSHPATTSRGGGVVGSRVQRSGPGAHLPCHPCCTEPSARAPSTLEPNQTRTRPWNRRGSLQSHGKTHMLALPGKLLHFPLPSGCCTRLLLYPSHCLFNRWVRFHSQTNYG